MCLFPKAEYSSTYEIPFGRLYRQGVRGVIFDIDNTLVLHDAPADERSIALFRSLDEIGLRSAIISNNDEPRVRLFAEAVGCDTYVYKAGKPDKAGYLKAAELMALSADEVVFVGDQLFTDIWGANRAGIFSILVGALGPEIYFHITLKRILEAPVRLAYKIFGRNNRLIT